MARPRLGLGRDRVAVERLRAAAAGPARARPAPAAAPFAFDEHQLEIVFVTGRRYRYLEVPEKTYTAMREAFSKGEFFNEQIRDHFAFVRLEDAGAAS